MGRSGVGAEQFIEEIAEPLLEHGDFSLGNGNRVGPVVRDGPCAEVVLGRAAHLHAVAEKRLKLLRRCGRPVRSGPSVIKLVPSAGTPRGRVFNPPAISEACQPEPVSVTLSWVGNVPSLILR